MRRVTRSPCGTPEGRRGLRGPRLLLVELPDQRKSEERSHVLEVRTHLETHSIPPRIALDVAHFDLRQTERPATARLGARVVHLGYVLPDPVVELAIEIALLLPAADVLALNDLQIVSETADDEDVG